MPNNLNKYSFFQQPTTLANDHLAQVTKNLVYSMIPNSSTRESLKASGYPENGFIESTIKKYRTNLNNRFIEAVTALETQCGNCSEMAYAAALILRANGFNKKLQIGSYGLNHVFLIVGNNEYIIDAWANKAYPFNQWPNQLKAYGGAVKEGIMIGRLLNPNHHELEDELPEVQTEVGSLDTILPPEVIDRLFTLLKKSLESSENDKNNLNNR